MARLIFVVGGAGAGKSTIARKLATRQRLVYLDMDTLLRPAAIAVMTQAGGDPDDRDSALYKQLCRDLGYRITMDAALENISLGLDVIVIGPFTKEMAEADWIEAELARIGGSLETVSVKVLVVELQDEQAHYDRIKARSIAIDNWKLENWSEFKQALQRREVAWRIPASSLLHYANDKPLDDTAIDRITGFIEQ